MLLKQKEKQKDNGQPVNITEIVKTSKEPSKMTTLPEIEKIDDIKKENRRVVKVKVKTKEKPQQYKTN